MVLTDKIKTGDIYIIDELTTNSPSTKYIVSILNELALSGKTLIVSDSVDQNLIKSVRNIPETNLIQVSILNVLETVRNKNMIITKDAVKKIDQIWGSKTSRKKETKNTAEGKV